MFNSKKLSCLKEKIVVEQAGGVNVALVRLFFLSQKYKRFTMILVDTWCVVSYVTDSFVGRSKLPLTCCQILLRKYVREKI
jgi:hypothetical protein